MLVITLAQLTPDCAATTTYPPDYVLPCSVWSTSGPSVSPTAQSIDFLTNSVTPTMTVKCKYYRTTEVDVPRLQSGSRQSCQDRRSR